MELIAVKELIEAGAHFGHKASRWNPRMKPYIFGKRNLIHIIDIRQTVRGIVTAAYCLKGIAAKNGQILFVGTKHQAQSVIEAEAKRCGMPYVSERWLGGILTNFETIHRRLNKLLELEKQSTDGTLERYNKKEKSHFQRELKKLQKNLGGIRDMSRMPDALVVVDGRASKIAVCEAQIMGIKTIGLIDTDSDPAEVDISIPVNDDAMKVIQIVVSKLADAVIEGKTSANIPVVKPLAVAGAQDEKKTASAEKEETARHTSARKTTIKPKTAREKTPKK